MPWLEVCCHYEEEESHSSWISGTARHGGEGRRMEPGSLSLLRQQATDTLGLHPPSSQQCVAWRATSQVQEQSRPRV